MSTHSTTLFNQFQRGGWAPANDQVVADWVKTIMKKHSVLLSKHSILLSKYSTMTESHLIPAVQEFKDFIESEPAVLDGFKRMFEDQKFEEIKDYNDLLNAFNIVLQQAPSHGPLGPPIYMLMYHVMNNKAGFDTFAMEKLNEHFKKLFAVWTNFLASEDSLVVLNSDVGGWFHEDAVKATTADFPGMMFDEIFVCNSRAMHWGYNSFDNYFNRLFRPGVRNVEFPERDDIIGGACESVLYKIATKVQLTDEFWIKGEPYSLKNMLHDSEYASQFDGGSVYQGFLQVTNYHRWHAPVTGTIKQIVDVPGTYFCQSPALLNDTEPHPYLRSLAYLTAVAARQLIFIEADNPKVGLMCFIAIGMTEISTCEATVTVGQRVQRGDELGMFHFGGSSHALVFGPETNIQWFNDYNQPGDLVRVNAGIGGLL